MRLYRYTFYFCIRSWYPNLIRYDLITFLPPQLSLIVWFVAAQCISKPFLCRFLHLSVLSMSVYRSIDLRFAIELLRSYVHRSFSPRNKLRWGRLVPYYAVLFPLDWPIFRFHRNIRSVFLPFCLPLCIVASRQAIHRHRRLQCRCLCTRPITTKIENSFWIF